MKYGLPYKGSKNKLAERIVSLLPNADHLIDLFCGGCAVTHAALLRGKYPHIHINDINWMCPTLFVDALNGKYKDDTRWISREDFEHLKDTDPYVAFVWSFGNNLHTYMYGKEIEDFKKALHYAIFYGDYDKAKEFGLDLTFLEDYPLGDFRKRYIAVKRYGRNAKITPPKMDGTMLSRKISSNECNPRRTHLLSKARPWEMQSVESHGLSVIQSHYGGG